MRMDKRNEKDSKPAGNTPRRGGKKGPQESEKKREKGI